jgi:hypothetical protein
VALVVVLLAAGTGSAQTRAPRLFDGMFGPTPAELKRPVRMDLTCSIYDAPDDNTVLTTDSDLSNHWYTGATATLAASRRLPHSQLTFNLASAGRFYPDLHQLVTMRHAGTVSFDTSPAKDWRVQMAGTTSFSPLYQVVFAPSSGAVWAPESQPALDDLGVSRQRAMQYGSMMGVTHSYSDTTRLSLNYGGHYTQVLEGPDSYSQRAGFQFNHALTRDFGLRLGYAYGVSATGADPTAVPIRNNDIDLGIVYGRSFTPSAHTSFNFSTGSTVVSSAEGRHFRVTGSGRLVRRLSPLWTANLTYDRGLQVPDGATRPFFSDAIGGLITGYVSHRVSFRAQPSFAHGVVGFVGRTNSYNSYANTTRLDIALNRRLALFTEHVLYRYQFANGIGLPSQLTSGVNRQTARVGLTLWTPLVR